MIQAAGARVAGHLVLEWTLRRHWNPAGVVPPFGRYHQAVLVESPSRLLLLSGLLGIDETGRIPASVEAQAGVIFAAIDRSLSEAGMTRSHLLRLTTFLIDAEDRPAVMAVRDAWVADPPPASTLLVVKALARPEFKVEIEAMAAG